MRKRIAGRLSGDQMLLLLLAVVDVFLILMAYQHFRGVGELSVDRIFLTPVEMEKLEIAEIEKLAERGAWVPLENRRVEKMNYYFRTHLRPSPTVALYFYPETLPERTFEMEFANKELKSSLDRLKKAWQAKDWREARAAFLQLNSRVRNYELGASEDENLISPEAEAFLRIYQKMAFAPQLKK